MTVMDLPDVGRIQGLQFAPASTAETSKVILQYTDRTGVWHQVTMPFLDAMFLLNLLRAVQTEAGFRMPTDDEPSSTSH